MKNKHNLQPSLDSNILEGSTTNTQVQTGNAEDSNGNTNIPHPIKLKCSNCKELKETTEFYISTKYPKRGFDYRCIGCCKSRSQAFHYENREIILSKWKTKREGLSIEDKNDIASKHKIWYQKDIRKRLLERAKDRSKRKNFICDLTIEDIIIPEKCPLLNEEFKYGSIHDKWFTYSIDRIDNSKGYVKGNIQVITYLANTMKSHASKKQLLTFAKNILELFKDDDIV